MKKHIVTFLIVGMLPALGFAQPTKIDPRVQPAPQPKTDFSKIFKSDKEKVGYAIGMSYGSGLKGKLKASEVDFDADAMIQGFKDGVGTGPTQITEAQMREVLNDLSTVMRTKMEEKRKEQAEQSRLKGETNKTEGVAFLAKNKERAGVVTLPSGLQYEVMTNGTGPIPTVNDEVTVNYRGTLINGEEFDNSAKHGKAFTTRVQGGIIKGWTEALQLMKTGSKWKLFIPSDLAYGASSAGPMIAPNSTLIFEIELVSTKAMPAPPTSPAAMNHPATSAPLTSDIIRVPSAEEIKKGAKIETIKAEDVDKARTNQ